MKRVLHLVILLIIFCCFCCSNAYDKKQRFRQCIKKLTSDEINLYCKFVFNGGPYLIEHYKNDDINFLDFDQNKFKFVAYNKKIVVDTDELYSFLGDAILTCVCRETYDPIFFITPLLNNGKLEDVYFYCVLGNPESFGIHDDYEIYDNLLFESIKTIPNTLITSLKDDDSSEVECYDKDGFAIKSIGNQKTCFFALKIIDSESFHESEIYSGPFISSELPTINTSNIFLKVPSCYTSVKNTTFKLYDSCIYIPSDSVFLCCCSIELKNCRIDPDEKKKLLCAPPEVTIKYGQPILYPMEKYLKESVNNACGIRIYSKESPFLYEGKNLPMFYIAYYSLNSCPYETTTVDFSKTRFCSSEAVKPEKIQIQKCCQNGHFCNLNLTAFKRNEVKPYKCAYKPDISFHFDESTTCELYYDLTLEKRVYLHENFTTKIIHKTLDGYMEIKAHDGKPVRYSCSYIYAEIINVDSKDCKQNYNEMGSIKPFYYCLCGKINCDAVTTMSPPKKGFECETVRRTDINYINIGKTTAKDKWICFVTTEFFTESSKIEAGHLDLNTAKETMKECFGKDTIVNSKFCCINNAKTNQSLTECTVEKQIERFEEDLKNPNVSQTLKNDFDSTYINCMPNDILNIEAEICPKTGGCFSTRILRPSTITSMDYIEPAGCLGYAEQYATLNLPLTSLSLGCRTNENSNRCSVVYGPNGEQRIVCCCNENGGNGKCETNLEKIPNNIGKPISSFKSL